MAEPVPNLIDGRPVPARSGRDVERRNPGDRDDVVGRFPDSDAADAAAAVAAARRALDGWRHAATGERTPLLERMAAHLDADGDAPARLSRDTGATLEESRAEIRAARDALRAAALPAFASLPVPDGASPVLWHMARPRGVCAVLSSWRAPLADPAHTVALALAAGNTVVLKPAEESPVGGALLAEAALAAGLPSGILNVVHGASRAGAALAEHPDVALLVFRGSRETAAHVAGRRGAALQAVVLAPAGSATLVVGEDADLDRALQGALWGAFSRAGQRWTSTRRLVLHRRIADGFTDRLTAACRGLQLGNALDPRTQVGPLVNERAVQRARTLVTQAKSDGSDLLAGGEPAAAGDLERGCFFLPTLLRVPRPTLRVARSVLPVPVLALLVVDSLEEAIHVANDLPHGEAAAIYTQDLSRALRAARDVEARFVCVNGPTTAGEDPGTPGAEPCGSSPGVPLRGALREGKVVRFERGGRPGWASVEDDAT